jgi:hypothetical protein
MAVIVATTVQDESPLRVVQTVPPAEIVQDADPPAAIVQDEA